MDGDLAEAHNVDLSPSVETTRRFRKRLALNSEPWHLRQAVAANNPPRVPVNLISGPLGIGKTTTINHLLSQRPEGERWAILVNEYGLVGLDAALMKPEGTREGEGVDIREIAGGCICCSAGIMFDVSLVRLLQRRPHRLLIEPTGLAALSGILDTLDRPGIREAVDVRSIVCLLDPSRLDEALQRDEVQDQVQAADVLLASRSDLAGQEDLDAFDAWARSLFPAKRFVGPVEKGRAPVELLDLVCDRVSQVPRAGHGHGTDHHHESHHDHPVDGAEQVPTELRCDEAEPIQKLAHLSTDTSTLGWVCWRGLVFDAERVSAWLYGLSDLPGTCRVKAVLRTNKGWWAFNLVDGGEDVRRSGYRRDSRLELIIEGEGVPHAATLESQLRGCVEEPDPEVTRST